MEQNVGKVDKIIRVIIAAVFAYLGYAYNYWWYVVAVLILVTALTGFCTLYKLFGINTCRR